METGAIVSIETRVERQGIVLESNGSEYEAEGVLNPASTRTRDGKLLVYPRAVAPSNVSRIEIVEASGSGWQRKGFALEPRPPNEIRDVPGGYGCEDPRITFVPLLDAYVMAYTAFGALGPRVAVALSHDGYAWERLGLADFTAVQLARGDDKDAAFFPEPVISPGGVRSFAFYHRPMQYVYGLDAESAVPRILARPPRERECIRIAYVPVDAVLRDRSALLRVVESEIVLDTSGEWGRVKNGAGTPPVRIDEGWFSCFHGVDGMYDDAGHFTGMRYSAGFVIHDIERPHIVLYRSPQPVWAPETRHERNGIVNDVVFPTGIDVRAGTSRDYDVYYGMADSRVGRMQIQLGESVRKEAEESAA
jgi:predicted GH43/DUF377 family glycosyl hydrolase